LSPVVAVPVRNEADRLPVLLEALARQTWLGLPGRRLGVVFVLNNCVDDSAEVLEAGAADHPNLCLEVLEVEFPPPHAHVGWARRVAMERACTKAGRGAVLFSTDADAAPAVDWIDASLRAVNAGADLVGGHIIGNKAEEALLGVGFVHRAMRHLYYAMLADHLASLLDSVPHDPWPRHSDHTGASLAVRGDVYAAVGGIPPLPFREDIAFVAKAVAAGYRLRHPLDVKVSVSARLDGRARGGTADCLRTWMAAEAAGLPHLVVGPRSISSRLALRRRKRAKRMGHALGLAPTQTYRQELWLRRISEDTVGPEHEVANTEIESAIKQIQQMVADGESAILVP
jgi:glycosyltransferase involved in cell wall biosynthesis